MIKLIVAVDRGNAIGWSDGRLPWKLTEDMKRFKQLTTNQVVMMGRKTFESLNRPDGLPQRKNVVVTRSVLNPAMGDSIYTLNTSYIDSTLKSPDILCEDGQDLWIIGGAQLYTQALKTGLVDEIHLTIVDADSGADVRLEEDLAVWKLFILRQRKLGIHWDVTKHEHPHDNGFNTAYIILTRT